MAVTFNFESTDIDGEPALRAESAEKALGEVRVACRGIELNATGVVRVDRGKGGPLDEVCRGLDLVGHERLAKEPGMQIATGIQRGAGTLRHRGDELCRRRQEG